MPRKQEESHGETEPPPSVRIENFLAQRPESRAREAVINRAIEVIGDEQEALRWLGTPVRALDYATPISRLNDPEGQAIVLNVLTQLEHGVL